MHSPISKQKLITLLAFLSLATLLYYIIANDNSPKNSTAQENDAKITILAHRQNEFGDMWVFDSGQFRCLSSEPPTLTVDRQSCMIKERPSELVFDYTKMQVSAIFLHPYPQKILILGLGGASMPKAISKALPSADLDIVEIDQNVVDLS
jgi:spermidine synthase